MWSALAGCSSESFQLTAAQAATQVVQHGTVRQHCMRVLYPAMAPKASPAALLEFVMLCFTLSRDAAEVLPAHCKLPVLL